ncbi:MAG: hypothetical protein HOV94_34005 [Saccharothrix sp.]|nr:hypothetical protein [Saccharothrix sp.]
MSERRIEVSLPARASANEYVAVTHEIWKVLSTAGLDDDDAVRTDDDPETEDGP